VNKRNRILSGVFALTVGLSLAMPLGAMAHDTDHDSDSGAWRMDHDRNSHPQAWRWEREQDHYRAYPYAPGYAYGNRPLPANGEGMINQRNPNLYWACDSDGHKCHWARRR
jgi:hypothetical protein